VDSYYESLRFEEGIDLLSSVRTPEHAPMEGR
jgi:hypothetical protein